MSMCELECCGVVELVAEVGGGSGGRRRRRMSMCESDLKKSK